MLRLEAATPTATTAIAISTTPTSIRIRMQPRRARAGRLLGGDPRGPSLLLLLLARRHFGGQNIVRTEEFGSRGRRVPSVRRRARAGLDGPDTPGLSV